MGCERARARAREPQRGVASFHKHVAARRGNVEERPHGQIRIQRAEAGRVPPGREAAEGRKPNDALLG
eukprot:2714322-Rhodomonas_salina.1